MTQLTLHLRDDVARQATTLAALEGKAVEDYLAGIVEQRLSADPQEALKQLETFTDEDVLAMADLRLSPEEDARLGELLALNQEGQLPPSGKRELDELMQIYDQGTLKKAMGWAEAVRRKLRKPINS